MGSFLFYVANNSYFWNISSSIVTRLDDLNNFFKSSIGLRGLKSWRSRNTWSPQFSGGPWSPGEGSGGLEVPVGLKARSSGKTGKFTKWTSSSNFRRSQGLNLWNGLIFKALLAPKGGTIAKIAKIAKNWQKILLKQVVKLKS